VHTKGKVSVLKTGDSFTMPRGLAHNGVNKGAEPARVVITLVVDKGAALRQPVLAPKGS
jgi:quercetin dioxygenase-like cupin family protein